MEPSLGEFAPRGQQKARRVSDPAGDMSQEPGKTAGLRSEQVSGQVEPVQVHDLVPGRDEIVHELLL